MPYPSYFHFPEAGIADGVLPDTNTDTFLKYYRDNPLKEGSVIDINGVGYEPGSIYAHHMTHMRHPLETCESIEEMQEFPFPDFEHADYSHQKEQADRIKAQDLLVVGGMQMTIWETAWYMRGMENLMVDMMSDDPMAEYLLDRVTANSVCRARHYALAGCDMISLGDDIGMQHSIMMSLDLYRTWLKPRLKQVIDAAREIKPDILVFYHSCGYVEPFIPDLIEIGVDILNPLQPECNDFARVHHEYGDVLSFNGTIGTQSVMPFGTPDDVRRKVFENLEIAGDKGGLFCCPTHLLEPEVPWENILAYVQACRDFK